jgi:hypothetical protein
VTWADVLGGWLARTDLLAVRQLIISGQTISSPEIVVASLMGAVAGWSVTRSIDEETFSISPEVVSTDTVQMVASVTGGEVVAQEFHVSLEDEDED